jgi:hypothetical protein
MRLRELEENPVTFEVNWVIPRRMHLYIDKGIERVVWVDVVKIDERWKLDRNFYVGPQAQTGSPIKGRYERFDNWRKSGEAVEMPEMGLGYRDLPSFTNGRHRFAWMRDHGAQAVPVVTPVDGADRFEEMFGSNLRKTIVTV